MIINLMLIVAVCLVGLYVYYNSDNNAASDLGQPQAESSNAAGGSEAPSAESSASSAGTASEDSQQAAPSAAGSEADAPAASLQQGGAGNAAAASADGTANASAGAEGNQSGSQGDAASASPEDAGGSLVLHFGGDTLFSGKVADKLGTEGYDFPFQYVSSLFQQDDLTVLNLETPVTDGGVGAADKQYVFKSSPKALEAMAAAGVDAVNLANNHTLDQGEEGLLDTLDHLKSAGIASVGAGSDDDQAYAPYYVEKKGIKIALFGFSRVLPKSDWAAGAGHPGIASVYDPSRAYAAVKAARQKADVVIVVTHWGKERVQQYDDTQQSLAHGLIDAGADLVIGGHPHVLQGLEQYKGKWIAYSTGNFIFTRSSAAKTWETALFEVRCTKTGSCSMKLVPYDAELAQPVPMDAAAGAKLLQEIQSLSPGVTVDKAGNAAAAANP
ncbi:CapA family protein [Paenibacillus pinistramenti]|uniref:CapA family protein n=1 Tax=Paenibacillus pinistramenti TaxID=1768003 RepID=UPI001EF02DBD|nr:CapA family protein [Paenibacillus pinistramenti]